MKPQKEKETMMVCFVSILNHSIQSLNVLLGGINELISENISIKFEYKGKLMSHNELQNMLLSSTSPFHTFDNGTKAVEISIYDVCYITCSGRIIFVRLTSDDHDEQHHFNGPLRDVYKALPKSMFFKIGRGVVVNIYHMECITDNTVVMKNEREFRLTGDMGKSTKMEVERLREKLSKGIHSQ